MDASQTVKANTLREADAGWMPCVSKTRATLTGLVAARHRQPNPVVDGRWLTPASNSAGC